MVTEPTERAPSVFLADLYALADRIGLTGGQLAAVAAWARQQERQVMHQAALIVAEAPFTREDNDPD